MCGVFQRHPPRLQLLPARKGGLHDKPPPHKMWPLRQQVAPSGSCHGNWNVRQEPVKTSHPLPQMSRPNNGNDLGCQRTLRNTSDVGALCWSNVGSITQCFAIGGLSKTSHSVHLTRSHGGKKMLVPVVPQLCQRSRNFHWPNRNRHECNQITLELPNKVTHRKKSFRNRSHPKLGRVNWRFGFLNFPTFRSGDRKFTFYQGGPSAPLCVLNSQFGPKPQMTEHWGGSVCFKLQLDLWLTWKDQKIVFTSCLKMALIKLSVRTGHRTCKLVGWTCMFMSRIISGRNIRWAWLGAWDKITDFFLSH